MLNIVAAVTLALASGTASPDQTCVGYVGTVIHPLSFEAAAAPFKSLRPKGEYETSAAYEARLRQISSQPLIVAAPIFNRSEAFQYNADAGELDIKRWAFEGEALIHHDAVWGPGGPLWDVNDAADLPDDVRANVEAVLHDAKTFLGTYRASNAFGASVKVFRYADVIDVIYERARPDEALHAKGLFSNVTTDDVIGTLAVPPEEAKALKISLKAAFVVVPKSPYYVVGSDHHLPTLDAANDTTTTVKVLLADMKCGLLMDANDKVLGAYPIR